MKRIQAVLSIVTLCALMGMSAIGEARDVTNQGIMIPAGTPVRVRMIDSIDSERNVTGQMFRASLDAPVVVHGRTVFPRGATAHVYLAEARSAGKVKGRSELEVQLASITSGGKTYPIRSDAVDFRGSSQGKKTAKSAGIGAAIGGGLGGIFGGGKGLALGAGLGAGTGVATRAIKGGQQVYIPSESLVNFRLRGPIHVIR